MNIRELMRQFGIQDMGQLEKIARESFRAMSPEERAELRKAFQNKFHDESFQEVIEGCYEEIKEEVEHEDDSEG